MVADKLCVVDLEYLPRTGNLLQDLIDRGSQLDEVRLLQEIRVLPEDGIFRLRIIEADGVERAVYLNPSIASEVPRTNKPALQKGRGFKIPKNVFYPDAGDEIVSKRRDGGENGLTAEVTIKRSTGELITFTDKVRLRLYRPGRPGEKSYIQELKIDSKGLYDKFNERAKVNRKLKKKQANPPEE